MSESKDSWLVKLSNDALNVIENSVKNIHVFNGQLRQLIGKTDEYTIALEKLLENKTGPRKEILELNKRLRAIKSQTAKIKEEKSQLDELLNSLDDE